MRDCFPVWSSARRNFSADRENSNDDFPAILPEEWRNRDVGYGVAAVVSATGGCGDDWREQKENGCAVPAWCDGWLKRRRPVRRTKLLPAAPDNCDPRAQPHRYRCSA